MPQIVQAAGGKGLDAIQSFREMLVVPALGQKVQCLLLQLCQEGWCVMPPQLDAAAFDLSALEDAEIAIGHRDLFVLP